MRLTVKIFIILGLTWILDIVAFTMDSYEQSHIAVQILVIVFLIINSSHGLIFFCVVFFTSATIKNMRTWFGRTRSIRRLMSNHYSTFRSTSSSRSRSNTFSSNRTRTTSLGNETNLALAKKLENTVSVHHPLFAEETLTLKDHQETAL